MARAEPLLCLKCGRKMNTGNALYCYRCVIFDYEGKPASGKRCIGCGKHPPRNAGLYYCAQCAHDRQKEYADGPS